MKKILPPDAVLVPDKAKKVFSGQIYDVYQWSQELFDGSVVTYEMLRRPDTIDCICVVNDKVIVLDDEQPHQGTITTFPSGKVDKTDDTMLVTAQREVAEETGYTFSNWKLLNVRQLHARTEWFIYTYVAWGVKKRSQPQPDAGERITVNLLPIDKVKQLCAEEKGYMGAARLILDKAATVTELLNLPEFKGREVDR